MYSPLVSEKDKSNYMMLGYYRNPLNQIFYNEGIIIVALQSFGPEAAWKNGVTADALYARSVFLNKLLQREEVQKDTITEKTRIFFDYIIEMMITRRLVLPL
jgi:hypothetical protein